MNSRRYVFVSYSHADEMWLERLRIFLKPFFWGRPYKAGGNLWADPYIRVGERWEREIRGGLRYARIGLLLISQDFLASKYIMEVEIPALLAAARADELTLACLSVRANNVDIALPQLLEYQWLRNPDATIAALDKESQDHALAKVSRDLQELVNSAGLAAIPTKKKMMRAAIQHAEATNFESNLPTGRLWGVPSKPPHVVARANVLNQMVDQILSAVSRMGVTGTSKEASRVGVHGQGGLGKTVSAIELVEDDRVRRAFSDGVYWLTLGQQPNLTELQTSLIEAMSGRTEIVKSIAGGRERLKELLSQRSCLLVLDDLWSYEHANAFDVMGLRSALLTTVRDSSLLTAIDATEIVLDPPSEGQALDIIASWTGLAVDELPEHANRLVKETGHLPLALSVAGAMVRDGTPWEDVVTALETGNIHFFEHPYAGVFTMLRRSLDALPDEVRDRYLELAVFPEDAQVPLATIERLWSHTSGRESIETRRLLRELDNKALLYLDRKDEATVVRIHDLQRDFLQLAHDDLQGLHRELLEAYEKTLVGGRSNGARRWWTMPIDEPYLWRFLASHLMEADSASELRVLLLEFDWLCAKIAAAEIGSLLDDFDALSDDKTTSLLQDALRLSAHILKDDPSQLPSQLIGRLGYFSSLEIRALLSRASAMAPRPWLRPLNLSMTPPGGPLKHNLVGHEDAVLGVAVSADGGTVISASSDGTVKVWDLSSGSLRFTLRGHEDSVLCAAVSSDGCVAASGSKDRTLKIWDLNSGTLQHTLTGNASAVSCVALSADGGVAVATSGGTVKSWSLGSRPVDCTFEKNVDRVRCLGMSADGRVVVLPTSEGKLTVLERSTGIEQQILSGHQDEVFGVALNSDGSIAVSTSRDRTVKLWDVGSGAMRLSLDVHNGWDTCVALSSDASTAVSGGGNTWLNVWDLSAGMLRHFLKCHNASVTDVSMSADGSTAVSASFDRSVKVWDLSPGALKNTGTTHHFRDVAISADGRTVIVGSHGGRLFVIDSTEGTEREINVGHEEAILCVALTDDGRTAISASRDTTVKVWDVGTGSLRYTLEGHKDAVLCAALVGDGSVAVSGSEDRTLKIWDLSTGLLRKTLAGYSDAVGHVAVSADGRVAITGSGRAIKTWDLRKCALKRVISEDETMHDVALSADGRTAASASFECAKVWDTYTGELKHVLPGPTRNDIAGIALSVDGRMAVSASSHLKVWDLTADFAVADYIADNSFERCALAADNMTIASTDRLGKLHIVRLERGKF